MIIYRIIDVESGEVIAQVGSLPATVRLPDGGVTLYSEAGQSMPAHAPRWRCDAVEIDDPPAARVLVPSRVIVDRLHAAGKLADAEAALAAADPYTRQRWNTRAAIYADDAGARGFITALGLNPDVILAPEE